MINEGKREVVFENYLKNDVKIVATQYGLAFGDKSVPDTDNVEDCYLFGILLAIDDVPKMIKCIEDIVAKKENSFEFHGVTFTFEDYTLVPDLLNFLLRWADYNINLALEIKDSMDNLKKQCDRICAESGRPEE